MRFLLSFILFLTLLGTACKPHVCTRNVVFDKYGPEAKEYKLELIKQLKETDPADIEYYISDYTQDEGKHYIEVALHSRRFCALTTMDISYCKRMEQLIELKGMSYRSAGISKPIYHIDSFGGNYTFILTDLDHIID